MVSFCLCFLPYSWSNIKSGGEGIVGKEVDFDAEVLVVENSEEISSTSYSVQESKGRGHML